MTGATKGILLGIANAVFITVAAALTLEPTPDIALYDTLFEGKTRAGQAGSFFVFAVQSALLVGLFLGVLADRATPRAPRSRFVLLAIPTILAIVTIGILMRWIALIPLAGVPTLVAVALLERWTRRTITELPAAYRR